MARPSRARRGVELKTRVRIPTGFNALLSHNPIPRRDSISRPITPVSSEMTPRDHGFREKIALMMCPLTCIVFIFCNKGFPKKSNVQFQYFPFYKLADTKTDFSDDINVTFKFSVAIKGASGRIVSWYVVVVDVVVVDTLDDEINFQSS
jgi:hypothetical protein